VESDLRVAGRRSSRQDQEPRSLGRVPEQILHPCKGVEHRRITRGQRLGATSQGQRVRRLPLPHREVVRQVVEGDGVIRVNGDDLPVAIRRQRRVAGRRVEIRQ